jgi:hypothetical protein
MVEETSAKWTRKLLPKQVLKFEYGNRFNIVTVFLSTVVYMKHPYFLQKMNQTVKAPISISFREPSHFHFSVVGLLHVRCNDLKSCDVSWLTWSQTTTGKWRRCQRPHEELIVKNIMFGIFMVAEKINHAALYTLLHTEALNRQLSKTGSERFMQNYCW